MASAREALTLDGLFGRAETPEILIKFLKEDLKLKSIADLVSYTAKKSYEDEWKELVAGAFPVRAPVSARDAVEATEDASAPPERLGSPGRHPSRPPGRPPGRAAGRAAGRPAGNRPGRPTGSHRDLHMGLGADI